MANNIINVNAELDLMKTYIADMKRCTEIVKLIRSSAWNYQSNVKTNIFTIICTVFTLICAIMQFHVVLIAIGVVLAVTMYFLAKRDNGGSFKKSSYLNIALLVSCIIFFMFMYNIMPVVVLVIDWIYTGVSNYKFKKLVASIGKGM